MVTGSGIYVFRAVRDQWFWRGEEYDKLRSLRAGYALPYFEDVLGRPIFTRLRLSRRTGFRESTFKGHGYWVQTLSMAGVVKLYAVTSCDKSFHPTFSTGEDEWIEVNRDTFADVTDRPHFHASFDYRLSNDIYRSYFYETIPSGGESHSVVWGVNELCFYPYELEDLAEPLGRGNAYARVGSTSMNDPGVQEFRRDTVVNTYAETAPGVRLAFRWGPRGRLREGGKFAKFHGFYIGPSRLQIGEEPPG